MKKRLRLAGELVALYEGRVRTKTTFLPDEIWIDGNTRARRNPKNDRKYYCKSTQKDSASEELKIL